MVVETNFKKGYRMDLSFTLISRLFSDHGDDNKYSTKKELGYYKDSSMMMEIFPKKLKKMVDYAIRTSDKTKRKNINNLISDVVYNDGIEFPIQAYITVTLDNSKVDYDPNNSSHIKNIVLKTSSFISELLLTEVSGDVDTYMYSQKIWAHNENFDYDEYLKLIKYISFSLAVNFVGEIDR